MADPGLSLTIRSVLLCGSMLALLAGCESGQFGFSGRDAELARRSEFSVLSVSASRAVVSARGQQVAVEPSPGFCLAQDSIETSDRSAFVLIGDCLLEDPAAEVVGAGGALDLPAGMPGIITVSISGDPAFSPRGADEDDLSELEAYLDSAEGRSLLGRGGDGSQVSVVDTRKQGDILYVLVEDRDGGAVPVLAPRFWRAFVELNDRLAVVTVSGFRDVPMDESEMLRHLGDQVRQLQVANAQPIDEAPVQVADAPARPRLAEAGTGDEVPVEIEVVEPAPAETAEGESISPEAALAALDAPGSAASGWAEFAVAGDIEAAEVRSLETEPAPEPSEAAELEAAGRGWSAIGLTGGPAEPADDLSGPGTPPLVVASTAAGGPGPWPMPAVRPDTRTPWTTAAPEPRSEPDAMPGMPVPLLRLVNPADRVAGSPAPDSPVPPPPRARR